MDEGDQVHKLHDKYADLGTLKVKVWRTVETGRGNHRNTNLKDLSAVPEKAIKGRAVDVSTRYSSSTFLTMRGLLAADLIQDTLVLL